MENLRAPTQEEDYSAAGAVHLACEKAYYFFCALRDDTQLNRELQLTDKARYDRRRAARTDACSARADAGRREGMNQKREAPAEEINGGY
jgi:hypothetical protein